MVCFYVDQFFTRLRGTRIFHAIDARILHEPNLDFSFGNLLTSRASYLQRLQSLRLNILALAMHRGY